MAKKLSFEAGMEELETLVTRLEQGEISLEESFKAYTRGVELYNALKNILDEGDKRITELTENGEREMETGEIFENA